MKNKLLTISLVLIASMSWGVAANAAATVFIVPQGGTGVTTFSSGQVLYGAGKGSIKTVATSTVGAAGTIMAYNASGGFDAYASSTIGGGGALSGLTISGTGTTTNFTITSVTGTQCLHAVGGVISGVGSDCATGGTPGGSDGQLQYKSGTGFAGVATTSATLATPLNGSFVGVGGTATIGWTGLATTTVLTANRLLYAANATTGVAPASTLTYLSGPAWYGNGTTTPQWLETLATTTAPQLVLEGGNGDPQWALRSIGGALYFATTTNTAGFATSTAANTALTIDTNGIPRFSALGGVTGCAQFDTTGKVSNTGSACNAGTVTSVTATLPIVSSGGATPNITWTGLATTTNLTANSLLYAANATTGVAPAGNLTWLNAPAWLGVGTSTPQWLLTLATTTAPQLVLEGEKTAAPWALRSVGGYLYIATTTNTATFATTSSMTAFTITAGGEVATGELDVATTTTTDTIDWVNTPNQVRLRLGTAAVNLQFINATNSAMLGSRKLVYICNGALAAGATTWISIDWVGSTPTQTTTANQCDVFSFDVTQATSTTGGYKVAGTAGTGFQ